MKRFMLMLGLLAIFSTDAQARYHRQRHEQVDEAPVSEAPAAAEESDDTLRIGDSGTRVYILQGSLLVWGHNPGAVDGTFGRRTKRALKAFQREHGLKPTGVADRATLAALKGVRVPDVEEIPEQVVNESTTIMSAPEVQAQITLQWPVDNLKTIRGKQYKATKCVTMQPWRLNNPGFLRGRRANWDGCVGTNHNGYARFATLADGARAAMETILRKYAKGKFRTSLQLTTFWTEIAGDRTNYACCIKRETGIPIHEDMGVIRNGAIDKDVLFGTVNAMGKVENGTSADIPRDVLEEAFRTLPPIEGMQT